MGIVKKKSILVVIITYAGFVLGYINTLVLFPKFFTAEEVGAFRLIYDTAYIFIPFIHLGAPYITTKFFPSFNQTPKEEQNFLGFLMALPFIGILLQHLVFIIFPNEMAHFFGFSLEFSAYIKYVAPSSALLALSSVFTAFLAKDLNVLASNFIQHLILRLVAMIGVVGYALDFWDFEWAVVVNLLGLIVQCIWLFGLCFRYKSFHISGIKSVLKHPNIGQMFQFGAYMILGAGSTLLIQKTDTIMTSRLLEGLSFTGIYTTAYYIGNVLEVPRRVIGQITTPIISKHFSNGEFDAVNDLYFKTSINQFVVGALFFLGIWVNIDNIFSIMPNGATYAAGKWVILFIALGRLYDLLWGVNGEILSMSKHYKWNLPLMGLLAILTIVTNQIFIPMYGISGTALATLITLVAINTIRGVFLYWKFKFQPFKKVHLYLTLITGTILLINQFIPMIKQPLIDICVRSIVISGIFLGGIYALKISEDINATINKWLKKFGL